MTKQRRAKLKMWSFLKLLPKKVDLIPEKVVSLPKTVDSHPNNID